MKKNYIAPKAEVICFKPVEKLASWTPDWDWSVEVPGESDNDDSLDINGES